MASSEHQNLSFLSPFLHYLAEVGKEGDSLPPLTTISEHLGISLASLREQLEVARALGLVEVRPRVGVRVLPYSLKPALLQSAGFAIQMDETRFAQFSDLRKQVEAGFWYQGILSMSPADRHSLLSLVERAEEKLRRNPPQLPHEEHRELHLSMYRKLNNPFVLGILEAYWDLYEAIGLAYYTDINYLCRVWDYHRRMVEAILNENLDLGFQLLMEHAGLLTQRQHPDIAPRFE